MDRDSSQHEENPFLSRYFLQVSNGLTETAINKIYSNALQAKIFLWVKVFAAFALTNLWDYITFKLEAF